MIPDVITHTVLYTFFSDVVSLLISFYCEYIYENESMNYPLVI